MVLAGTPRVFANTDESSCCTFEARIARHFILGSGSESHQTRCSLRILLNHLIAQVPVVPGSP